MINKNAIGSKTGIQNTVRVIAPDRHIHAIGSIAIAGHHDTAGRINGHGITAIMANYAIVSQNPVRVEKPYLRRAGNVTGLDQTVDLTDGIPALIAGAVGFIRNQTNVNLGAGRNHGDK